MSLIMAVLETHARKRNIRVCLSRLDSRRMGTIWPGLGSFVPALKRAECTWHMHYMWCSLLCMPNENDSGFRPVSLLEEGLRVLSLNNVLPELNVDEVSEERSLGFLPRAVGGR
jgi:hypothetical protein